MGTRSKLVFRIKGKIVMQIYVHYDGYPTGNPASVAKLLLELTGEVQVQTLIIAIIATLAAEGNLEPMHEWFGTTLFIEYCYVFDFDDELAITVVDHDESVTIYDIRGFAFLCELYAKRHHTMPTFKFDTPLEGKELVQMVNSSGKPLFFMAAKNWYKKASRFVLGAELQSCWGGCGSALILQKTFQEFCGDDVFILPDVKRDVIPTHTIAFYKPTSTTALHDERDKDTTALRDSLRDSVVLGIHSHTRNGIVLRKAKAKASNDDMNSNNALNSPKSSSSLVIPRRRASAPFIAWTVGSSRHRANWQLTTLKQFRNILRLITVLAIYVPPQPSIKRNQDKKEKYPFQKLKSKHQPETPKDFIDFI